MCWPSSRTELQGRIAWQHQWAEMAGQNCRAELQAD
jgi:hypothetical protein